MSRAAELMESAVRMERTAATADEFETIERLKQAAHRMADAEAQRAVASPVARPKTNAALLVLPIRR